MEVEVQPASTWADKGQGGRTLGGTVEVEQAIPRDIMSSEPRDWMVFGQFVMPVQCCAKAPAAAAPLRHDQLAKYHTVPWLSGHNVS